jgi:hypothetical protein
MESPQQLYQKVRKNTSMLLRKEDSNSLLITNRMSLTQRTENNHDTSIKEETKNVLRSTKGMIAGLVFFVILL